MFRYSCFGHRDGSFAVLQCNSLAHAEEWIKQNTEEGLESWIWDLLLNKKI